VLNHHNFCSISIGKVIKCSHCSWPIWGYMSNPFRCTGKKLEKKRIFFSQEEMERKKKRYNRL